MATERVQRRLAAILVADVVGYSRLMERDEGGTLAALKGLLKDLLGPLVTEHHGRIVKVMGDGVLVEFDSAVNAVACAVQLQKRVVAENDGIADDRRMVLRIGVNLGDVIAEGGDLYGDGVNVAARLEGLAEAGGVMISSTVYDHVEKKLAVGFEFQGEQRVKNIDKPVRVYRVLTDPAVAGKTISVAGMTTRWWRRPTIAAGMLLLVVTAGAAVWLRPWEPRFEPNLPLPDKPSIAVLPFTNLTADPNEDYLANGIADDLTTDLSRISGLFVIARNSTFAYKGKSIDVRDVAQELGVHYVLQGSVQRAGDQVRINAQLVDATTGGHRWAERYDGSIADIFALQDKVTNAVADTLALQLTEAERLVLHQDETSVATAYVAFLRGWEHYRRTTPQDFAKAIPYFEEAIKLDPNYGRAYAALALVYAQTYAFRWSYGAAGSPGAVGSDVLRAQLQISDGEALARARQYLLEAQKRPTALTHHVAGILLQTQWLHSQAIAEIKEAIALEPGEPWNYAVMSWILTSAGRPAEAVQHIRTAMRLDPHSPAFFTFLLGLADFSLEHFEEAAASLERVTRLNPDSEYDALLLLAATYGHLGRQQDASSAVSRFNAIRVERGDIPITIATAPPFDYSKFPDMERLDRGLGLAGVPESLLSDQFIAGNQLTADAVRQLFVGHRLRGRTFATGEEHAASITTDGSATLSGNWGSFTDGNVQFNDDEICYVRSGGVRFCGIVVRNPGGSRAMENELIWIDARGAFTFSQVE
jgi:adenylate cyclase